MFVNLALHPPTTLHDLLSLACIYKAKEYRFAIKVTNKVTLHGGTDGLLANNMKRKEKEKKRCLIHAYEIGGYIHLLNK